MKNQHPLHQSQKAKLFFPSIISMSLIKRLHPVECENYKHKLEFGVTGHFYMHVPLNFIFTVYVGDTNELQERQK